MTEKNKPMSFAWIGDLLPYSRVRYEDVLRVDDVPPTCDMCGNEAELQSLSQRGKYKYCPECLIELDEV